MHDVLFVRFVLYHYDNMPMRYIANFNGCKDDTFWLNFLIFFSFFFARNKDCGYSLEPLH